MIIEIIPAAENYEKLIPGVANKISTYNNIIRELFDCIIPTHTIPQNNGVMSDSHHLNAKGHNMIYNEIINKIK